MPSAPETTLPSSSSQPLNGLDAALIPLQTTLLGWYDQQGRALPWRQTQDPYAIWVSEIMLQQTQVKTVLPYYQRWLVTFPTIQALAQAPQQQVLKAWEGLGYYARARNLHRAAQVVVENYGGVLPTDLEAIMALPGIGRTTAGGILSAAFNLPFPILDGNVKRVLARLIALEIPPQKALDRLWAISNQLLPVEHPRDFNQALMDLGATLCTKRQPSCTICPWQAHCKAYQQNMQSDIPVTEAKPPIPHKQIGVAVVWDDQNQVLIDRRPQQGLLGGLWEFPGGKVEPGETIEACIRRELQEELAIEVEVGDRLITLDHAYTHFKVTLHVYHCHHVNGEPQPLACDEIRWVTVADLEQYPFPTANGKIIEALKALDIGQDQSVSS